MKRKLAPKKIKGWKNKQINIRLSTIEQKVIQEASKLQGYSMSDLILRDTFIKAKKYLQAKGYKISQKAETLRGIDLFLKPGRIGWNAIRSIDQLKIITAPAVQNSKDSCLLCGQEPEIPDEPESSTSNN